MKKLIALSIFLFLSSLLFACATTKEVMRPPAFSCSEPTLSKEIDKGQTTATPLEVSSSFSAEDPQVIATVNLEKVSGEHKLRWEWYDASGNLYLSTGNYPLTTSPKKYRKEVTTWHKLSIRGEKAANQPGDWQVKFYLDNDLVTSKSFRIDLDVEKPPRVAQKPNPKNWGFIIGIERYANLPTVDFAEKDASLMRMYFQKVLGIPEENIIFLLDSKATKSTLEGYFKGYLPNNLEKDANLYVYYAGHGAPDIKEGNAYLIPYDGDPRFITQTGYKLKDFYADLSKLNIQRSFVFLDACFSGVASRGEKMLLAGIRPALIHVEDITLMSDKVISLTATKGEQVSNSYPETKHGLFTYFLLGGLKGSADINGDGHVSLGELYNYVKDNVNRVSRKKGVEQTPAVNPSFEALKGIEGLKISRVVK